MKITVTEQIFLDEFRNSSRADQFSREALVGICCEYVEVENSDTDELENYSNCDVIAELASSTVFYQS